MRVLSGDPPNLGVAVEKLNGDLLDQEEMYVRCNFKVPSSPPDGFEVVVPGSGRRFIRPEDLTGFEKVTRDIVLECAGNGRAFMSPTPAGAPWELDGVSPVTIGGYRLADVLDSLPDDVVEVVFTGADIGTVEPEGKVPYQFSIGRDLATSPLPLLVTHIGGEPLDLLHGAPIRLVVPGHYAMMSVKWLTRVEAVVSPFEGHFVKKYRYYGDQDELDQAPVREIAVRSVITEPADGATVPARPLTISGSAWSASELRSVEVSIDGGQTWEEAELVKRAQESWTPTQWSLQVSPEPGDMQIMARATDVKGSSQPLHPRWNANGYANNVVHQIAVTVGDAA